MVDAAQANPQGLMSIGTVAAHNIAAAVGLDASHVGTIEQAIKDEINAMSSHFTLAVADVQTQYEVEVTKIKSVYKFAEENLGKLIGIGVVLYGFGFATGYLV